MTSNLNRRQVLAGLTVSTLAMTACRSSDKSYDADIIILGAGLSGLHAARLLAAEGKDVLVLEGSQRIGGRLHTLDHGENGFTEAGGEQVGANYARIIDTARELDVAIIPDGANRRQTAYYYQDSLMTPERWANSESHPFAEPFKGASPGSPLFRLAAQNNPLKTAEDWRDPKFAEFDVSADTFLTQAGLDAEAKRVINVALNGNSLDSYSMMNLYRSLQLFSQSRGMGASGSIEGGAQRLPEAMAKSLPRSPIMNQTVTRISEETESVVITTASGQTYRAQHCICALPFGALRHIKLSSPVSTIQSTAISNLPYTQIYQVHFKATDAFWEKDELPTDMWTDSPIERVFANMDNDGNPTGLFRAWVNGTATTQWAGLTPSDRNALFQETLSAIRPATQGHVEVLTVANWTRANKAAGGAYMHWAPGQIKTWAGNMASSTQRLHFAGEHLSYLHTGMEGAMESAENAIFKLLDL